MAARFDNSADYLRRTASLPSVNNVTACGWCMRISNSGGWQFIFELGFTGGDPWMGLDWQGDGGGNILEINRKGGSSEFLSSPADNSWFFWALTSSATDFIGYWAAPNAASLIVAPSAGPVTSFPPISMTFMNDEFVEPVNGRGAGFKVWDAVLTEAELLLEMRQLAPFRRANLHGFWPMFAHTHLDDLSGNGRTLTAGGTLTTEEGPPVPFRIGRRRYFLPFVVQGGASTDANAPVTGQSATASLGNVTVTTTADVSVTGLQATGSVGAVTVETAVEAPVTGVSATGNVGTVTVESECRVEITGLGATGQLGDVTVVSECRVEVSGLSATAELGTVDVPIEGVVTAPVEGLQAEGQLGSVEVRGDVQSIVSGVSAAGAVGTVTVELASQAAVEGVAATGSVGEVGVRTDVEVAVTGVAATAQLGAAVAAGHVDVLVQGFSAAAQLGTTGLIIDSNVPVTGVSATAQLGTARGIIGINPQSAPDENTIVSDRLRQIASNRTRTIS